MSTSAQSGTVARAVTETARRRWRLAALIGLAALLSLVAVAVLLIAESARVNRTVAVLKATRDIQAGTVIASDDLGVANVHVDDDAVLAGLTGVGDRSQLIGKVASDSVRAGGLIPAGLGAPEATASMWALPLPVKQRPPDLKVGDHVALLVSGTGRSGQPVEVVAAQDVVVLAVEQDVVDVWLPASAAAQMELYAGHGDVVVARMQAGAVQNDLPPAGGS